MTLSSQERVRMAVRHQEPDRLPRGELLVEEGFLDRFYPEKWEAPWREKMRCLAEEAGLDLVTISLGLQAGETELREIGWWIRETDRFVTVLLDGLFWHPEDPLSFEEFLLGMRRQGEAFRSLMERKRTRTLNWIERCLEAGAHGCIIGDDIAYNKGPFVSPEDLETWIFPGLREMAATIKGNDGIAVFHSCGNLTGLFDMILSLGFDVLHGLAPSAGNDSLEAGRKAQGRMTLMGAFDIEGCEPQEIEDLKKETLPSLSVSGGYILGSASGLSQQTPLDSFRALYGL